jgi:hypothetical protein
MSRRTTPPVGRGRSTIKVDHSFAEACLSDDECVRLAEAKFDLAMALDVDPDRLHVFLAMED